VTSSGESPLVVCAIFRDEAPYLAEWVAFHRLVGVGRFLLYDNGSADDGARILRPYLDEGVVEIVRWPMPFHLGAARAAYADAVERTRGRARWLAAIDVDEFLFSPRGETLPAVLREYEAFPGVVVRWRVYGSSGHERSADEPVIARFRRRAADGWVRNRRVKSIVDPARVIAPDGVHHFVYEGGACAVDERKQPVLPGPKRAWRKRLRPWYRLLGPLLRHLDPYARSDLSSGPPSAERLRINHYPVKSREEFERKARLKEGKQRYEGIDYFAYHDRNEVLDPILERYLPALSRELERARAFREANAANEARSAGSAPDAFAGKPPSQNQAR
jgi:hypothetical protein